MRWRKRNAWKIGIAITGTLLLLLVVEWIPVSVAGANAGASGVATPGKLTVQVTPTEDATVTALNKELLTQQVAQQQHTWDNWLWSNTATILSSFLSTLVIVIGALVGLWRWRRDRRDTQDKELQDRQIEREKQAEERFRATVTGLGDEKEGAKIGAAILLRTFLRPGYEQFYAQSFDLAVAHLRLPRNAHSQEDPDAAELLTTLSQALIVVFKEAFPLARDLEERNPQSFDATGIRLDNATLLGADLKQIWMPQASLRGAHLSSANLSKAQMGFANLSGTHFNDANLSWASLGFANLSGAYANGVDLSGAFLYRTDLSRAYLYRANLSGTTLQDANLSGANLSGADLRYANLKGAVLGKANLKQAEFTGVDLTEATLTQVNLEEALSLKDADLRGATGLTKEQLEACKAKGAVVDGDLSQPVKRPGVRYVVKNDEEMIDGDPSPLVKQHQPAVLPSSLSQSNDAQAPSVPSAQVSVPTPDPDGSSATSSTNS